MLDANTCTQLSKPHLLSRMRSWERPSSASVVVFPFFPFCCTQYRSQWSGIVALLRATTVKLKQLWIAHRSFEQCPKVATHACTWGIPMVTVKIRGVKSILGFIFCLRFQKFGIWCQLHWHLVWTHVVLMWPDLGLYFLNFCLVLQFGLPFGIMCFGHGLNWVIGSRKSPCLTTMILFDQWSDRGTLQTKWHY